MTPAEPHASRRRAWVAAVAAAAMLVAATGAVSAAAASGGGAAPTLRCRLEVPARSPAGAALMLRLDLTNTGTQPLRVLVWNTPFEPGWFAPFVVVSRGGEALAYRGASVKRGEPVAADYLVIGAGRTRSARIDLAEAFDLSRGGHYRIEPRLTLHDVALAGAALPRPRDARRPQPLDCRAVEFERY